jgi:transposase InsO family protein
MHINRSRYRVTVMCEQLNVSKAGYYAWRQRKQSTRQQNDAELLKSIQRLHAKSRAQYGQPRIRRDLLDEGVSVSRKRVARIMRFAGIKAKKRCFSKAASSSPGIMPAAENVLKRRFKVSEPNRVWVTDTTTFMTKQGRFHLTVVIDLYSRRVVGWSMGNRIDAAMALRALKMALHRRPYYDLIVHSDRGSQFACREYAQFLTHCGITASMSRKGNCWDNAVVESFFASIKVEIKPDLSWGSHAEVGTAIFEYIETWYNPQRRHSTNGYLSPVAYENRSVA